MMSGTSHELNHLHCVCNHANLTRTALLAPENSYTHRKKTLVRGKGMLGLWKSIEG